MNRPRFPSYFKTKRELLWYVRGLKEAKTQAISYIQMEEKRYLESLRFMEFDNKGNLITPEKPRERITTFGFSLMNRGRKG